MACGTCNYVQIHIYSGNSSITTWILSKFQDDAYIQQNELIINRSKFVSWQSDYYLCAVPMADCFSLMSCTYRKLGFITNMYQS